jgi:hypothetical protein
VAVLRTAPNVYARRKNKKDSKQHRNKGQFSFEACSVNIMSKGNIITCRAAVVWAAGEKLKIEEVQVDPPKKGEVRIKIIATSICREFVKSSLKF